MFTSQAGSSAPANPEHPLWIGRWAAFKQQWDVFLLSRNTIFTVSLV